MPHSHSGHAGYNNTNSNGGSWLFSRTGLATLVAVTVLGFLIYTGHGAHLLGYLPYLLILLCPLMHIFMHGGHGGHGGHGSRRDEEETRAPEDQEKNKEHSHGGHH